MAAIDLGVIPRRSGPSSTSEGRSVPIVQLLPEDVCPYARMVQFIPATNTSTSNETWP